ncbi:hypothetical protein PENSPDRAFT_656203 [Peniophora sp. CONT]|nr:hypothetical protein PENSPDRAFT_656203 [Peniophora sp. CONT]
MDHACPSSLPIELVLYIFDIAADISRQSILSLCLIASWAYEIYLPRLLRVVDLTSDRQSRDFMARLSTERIEDRLSHVRTLWVDRSVQHAQHNPALQAHNMPRLRHLSAPYSLFTAMSLFRAVEPAVGLQVVLSGDVPELALCMRALWDGHALPRVTDTNNEYNLDMPVLNAITHIQLTCPAMGWRSPVFLCANLTHLAMPFVGVMGFNNPIRSLQMMVFVVPSYRSLPTHWDCRMRVVQARRLGRAIFSVTEVDERSKEQWLEAVSGRYPSIWERAKLQTELLEQLYEQCSGNWDAIQTLWQERSSKDDPTLSAISGRGLTPRLRRP